MSRIVTGTVAATLGLAAALVAVPAMASVTNPADNPHKITVTGDDGKTYVDGQDTLPGYDDEACTYIPGAWFDFDNNRVRYPDGQSIPWTEWERATGYQEWLNKKAAAAPAPAQAAPAANQGTASQASTSGASSSGGTTAAQPGATPSPGASAQPSPSARPSASAEPSPSADAVATTAEAVAAAPSNSGSAGASSAAGLAILAVLFGLGGAAFGGYTFFRGGKGGSALAAAPADHASPGN